jgi:hypothetical protein
MADFADDAQAMEELALSHAIASARKTGERQLAPRGSCYNCEEVLKNADGSADEKRLFCDEFCSEDWHKRSKIQNKR